MTVRRAFALFVVSVALIVVVVGAIGLWLLHHAATGEALDDARVETAVVGKSAVAPLVTGELLAGAPAARAPLEALRRRGGYGSDVEHVKVWGPDGTVLYASEPELQGRRFDLGEEEREVLEQGGTEAEVSDLGRPENQFERGEGKLLEVYAGLAGPGGRRVLFETYRPYRVITGNEGRLRGAFAPALIAAVALLALLVLPLVLGLARALERGRADRERLLRQALDASDRERLRVARELHDGPVQRLSGVAFALAGAARGPGDADLRDTLESGAGQVRETVRELRGTLTELVPPNLHRQGLRVALSDLLAPLRAAGVDTALTLEGESSAGEELTEVLYRVAAEGIRNARTHAEAGRVAVTVVVGAETASVTVADDGRGMTADARDRAGHFGLRLLDDLARQRGGRVEIGGAEGSGTILRFEVPSR